MIPFGAGSAPDRLVGAVAALADPLPVKHVTYVHDGISESIETRAATAEALLAERHVARSPDDALSVDPASSISDGETLAYRAAVPVTVIVDGAARTLRSAAESVSSLLAAQGVAYDRHDIVTPAPGAGLSADAVVTVKHVPGWVEFIRGPLAAKTVKKWAFTVRAGTTRVVDPGRAGIGETAYAVHRIAGSSAVRRVALVSRVIRAPHDRIVAEGIGEYTALSALARRGVVGTLRLAGSALSMVATAYTAACGGCSGMTAIGRPAGHGVVAVDPRVIPLGTRMFIPGYGHAIAGDTGGSIRGRRIDLGFDSNSEANQFGRRSVTVYLIK